MLNLGHPKKTRANTPSLHSTVSSFPMINVFLPGGLTDPTLLMFLTVVSGQMPAILQWTVAFLTYNEMLFRSKAQFLYSSIGYIIWLYRTCRRLSKICTGTNHDVSHLSITVSNPADFTNHQSLPMITSTFQYLLLYIYIHTIKSFLGSLCYLLFV